MLERLIRLSVLLVVLVSALAWTQVERLGPVHVDPQTGKEGVRVSFERSATLYTTPEIVKIASALASANGLDRRSRNTLGPWHVELTYDEFDEDGDNVHSGNIEEFYIDPTKYRRTIKTESVQTEVATGTSVYRIGDQGWPNMAAWQAFEEAIFPFYRIGIANFDTIPDKLDWTVGKTKLSCIVLRSQRILSDNGLPKFCYEPGTTVLRYTRGTGWDETVYNNIFEFRGRYVAHDVEVTHAGKPYLKIHVSKIESLPQLDNAMFSAPPDSPGPITEPVRVPGALLTRLPSASFPSFPRGVHGKVTLTFTIDRQGHVETATAIDGPEELRKPAEEAVKAFQFRPFLLLDKPVEVESKTFFEVH